MSAQVKLLVADDEAVVRRFIRAVVEKEGLPVSEILEAANGVEAVALAARHKPDLALLDIRMPGLSGLEAVNLIMKQRHDIRVYVISAYDEFDYARAAFKAGVCDYLVKPVRPAQIVDIVSGAVRLLEETSRPHAEALPPLVQAVSDFIAARLNQHLALEEIARAVFVSPCHLSRKFKALTGQPLSAFVQDRRLERAAELLRTTDESVTEIAGQVGFTNPSYFATCFKAAHAQTPQQYRKIHRSQS
ncbi:MAG: response regulator [Candidatus Adiutrix sp.]|jgi:YesN/AraC family two-component response regulator|nr:response regulator [Candidatus Adiutrix sp.]